jgi:3-phosphoshikimate 1-carboxyvinyltransferase
MAMAFAPLAITMGEIRINDPEVVSKSYPKYWEDLKKAGFTITESPIPTT